MARASTAKKTSRTRRAGKRTDGLSAEWRRVLDRDQRQTEAVERWRAARAEWRASGGVGSPPRDPWDDTNWPALRATPRARTVFRTMAAQSGTLSLEDFRDLLRCAAMAAATLGGRHGTTGRNLFTPFQEILLVLSNAVEVVPGPAEDVDEDAYLPASVRREGINVALLEALHAPARKVLADAPTDELRTDGRRTGIRFVDVRTGKAQKSAAGRELVAAIQRLIGEGLRGVELADALAGNAVWVVGAFSDFAEVRWKDPDRPLRRDTLRARLERWATDPRTDFDAATDYEALAVRLLVALGMNPKAARNAVSAAEDMRERRRRARG